MSIIQKLSEVSTFTVIGASGYIGSKLVNKLTDSGCNVIRSSRRDTITNGDSEFVMAELDSLDFWLNIVEKSDVIIHLAGNTSINVANDNPALDLNSSVVPIYRLIEACKILRKRPRVVFASTVTAYGFTDNLPVSEATAENPESFYDLHKFFVERQLVLATKLNICDGVSLRLANVYGPSSANSSANDRGILNKIIGLALAGDIVSLYGNGNYIRDYIYIDDVVNAFLHASVMNYDILLKRNDITLNVASGKGASVIEVFKLISNEVEKITGIRGTIKNVAWPKGVNEIEKRNYIASIELFKSLTGWEPSVSLEEGIQLLVKHYSKECISNEVS